MPQQSEVVAAEVAYEAAKNRALRTTEALILAEAQVETWRTLYYRVVDDRDGLQRELDGYREAEKDEGVIEDGADDQDPPGYTEAVGQAD